MLRTILSIAGVALIGLGVFGGPLLGNITEQISDRMVSKDLPSTNNAIVTEGASVEVAAVAPQTKEVMTETVIETASAAAIPDTKVVTTSAATTPTASAALSAATQSVTETAGVTETADTEIANTEILVEASTGEVAEPMAPAQAAGDLIAMTEKAKSSSRNEQVKLAQTVLTAAKQPAEPDPLAKTTEVEALKAATTGELSNEILVVVKDKVNLRDGPSIDHPIVLQLQQGQELMEFKREGRWVHVGAYGTSGKIGWVHQRLVSATE